MFHAAFSSAAFAAVPSTNSTDSPGATTPTPVSAIAVANALELSSTIQPVRSIGVVPRLVTSNQSAPYGLLPLLQGETSVTATVETARVSVALVASGVAPTVVSSTATATLKLARSSGVAAFRYSAPPSIS